MAPRRRDPVSSFWSQVEDSAASDCWLWTGGRTNLGYGRFWNGQKIVPAHRWSYEYMVNDIPDGYQIDHLCSVRDCVNPFHLEVVTGLVNMQRASARGRLHGAPVPTPTDHAGNYRKPGRIGTVVFRGDPGVHIAMPTGRVIRVSTEAYVAGVGVFVKEKT